MQDSEIRPGEPVRDVHFTEDTLAVDLIDGRTIVVPLVWYPRLLDATPEQRRNWRVSSAASFSLTIRCMRRRRSTCTRGGSLGSWL